MRFPFREVFSISCHSHILWHKIIQQSNVHTHTHTHTHSFPGKPVVSEILLCEAPEFCSDASGYDSRTIYHKVGKILVLNRKFVMTCICVCM